MATPDTASRPSADAASGRAGPTDLPADHKPARRRNLRAMTAFCNRDHPTQEAAMPLSPASRRIATAFVLALLALPAEAEPRKCLDAATGIGGYAAEYAERATHLQTRALDAANIAERFAERAAQYANNWGSRTERAAAEAERAAIEAERAAIEANIAAERVASVVRAARMAESMAEDAANDAARTARSADIAFERAAVVEAKREAEYATACANETKSAAARATVYATRAARAADFAARAAARARTTPTLPDR